MKNAAFLILAAFLAWGCSRAGSGEPKSTEVTSQVVVESTLSWDNSPLPAYPVGTPKVTLLRISIPAGAKLALHKHPIINVGLLTKGELTVTSETGQTLQLKAGDGIVELVNTYHYGENRGTQPAEIVVFYAGDTESVLSIKE